VHHWFNPSIAHHLFTQVKHHFQVVGFGAVPNLCQNAKLTRLILAKWQAGVAATPAPRSTVNALTR
jgi:hypothetical protein